MASVRLEKKMILNIKDECKAILSLKSHKDLAKLALTSALPFFTRKTPAETIILPCLELSKDLKTLNAINTINKKAHEVFNPIMKSERLQRSQQLLNYVAHGNQIEAEKMLTLHPGLLMVRGTTKTYAEDTIEDVNPLELAYGEHDNDMFEMMQRYVNRLPQENQTNLFNQLKERFPETKEEKYDFSPIITAITSLDKKTINAAMDQFRNDFAPRLIRREDGNYLNRVTNALLDVMQIYDNQFNSWTLNQLTELWSQVVGYLQRRLSACYAQAHCQGLYNVTGGRQPLRRDLKLDNGSLYFADSLDSRSGLGFDFALISRGVGCVASVAGRGPWCSYFKAYVEQKRSSLERVCSISTGNNLIRSLHYA